MNEKDTQITAIETFRTIEGEKPRLTYPFTLSRERRNCIELLKSSASNREEIESLLSDEDFVVRITGIRLINEWIKHHPDDISNILTSLESTISDDSYEVLAELAMLVCQYAPTSFPILHKLFLVRIQDKLTRYFDPLLFWVLEGFSRCGQNARNEILEVLNTPDLDDLIYTQAITSLLEFSNDPAYELELLYSDKPIDSYYVFGLRFTGDYGLNKIKELVESNSDKLLLKTCISALLRFGLKQSTVPDSLQLLCDHPDTEISTYANTVKLMIVSPTSKQESVITTIDSDVRAIFLGRKKSLFASPNVDETIKRIVDLTQVASTMSQEYPDDFVGINIYGSLEKGYFTHSSDVDLCVFFQSELAEKRFRDLIHRFPYEVQVNYLRVENDLIVQSNQDYNNSSEVFYGLFIGDRQKLERIQVNTLESVTPPEWNQIREQVYNYSSSHKLDRFGFDVDANQKIGLLKALETVPPLYHEARHILLRRVRTQPPISD